MAAPSSSGRARGRVAALRGKQFAPYGFEADKPAAIVGAHEHDFDACWTEGDACLGITCRFVVATTGAVKTVSCSPWEGRPACPATQSCIAGHIRALPLPPPAEEGECMLFFSPR